MILGTRARARLRAEVLFERILEGEELHTAATRLIKKPGAIKRSYLRQKVFYAGCSLHPFLVCLCSLVAGISAGWLLSFALSVWVLPLFVIAVALLPWAYLDSCSQKRAAEFSVDYPTVLLATASSIKVGLTPFLALERSIRLLPRSSLMRKEVEKLVSALRQGETKEIAIANFAENIALPDLPLFRAAFLLVMENGGRFAPTLHRLASVSKDRAVLISSARVSTATMRMTANILLCVAPVLVFILSSRMEHYWELFREHPVANTVASTGILIISASYIVLRRMSAFKP